MPDPSVDDGRKGMSLRPSVALGREIVRRIGEERTTGVAAEMAFWLFLSLLPIAAVSGLVAARFAIANRDSVNPFLQSLPPAARESLSQELNKVAAWNGGAVAPISALVFVWLASSGVSSIFDALETQTGLTRPWWKKRLVAIGTCVALSLGVAVLALLGTGLQWLSHLAGEVIPRLPGTPAGLGSSVLRLVMGALVSFSLVAFLYWVGTPLAHRRRMPFVPGALFVVVLNAILAFAYGFYISKTGTGDAYQAGLAVIGIILTALYLFSVAVLLGAMINQLVAERRGIVVARRERTL